MDATQFHNLIAVMKSDAYDTAERALLVEDPAVRAVVIAWPNCRRRYRYGRKSATAPGPEKYDVLWKRVSFDNGELRRLSGVAKHEFARAWGVAVGNRLIFPDGTLAKYVTLKLQAMVVGQLPRRAAPRQPEKPKEVEKPKEGVVT